MLMKIIGVCGLARSGKDTVADYIESKYGFQKYVMSDVLRDELVKCNRDVSKRTMLELGNELREAKGLDIVAQMIYERCHDSGKVSIVGFRSPAEVEFFERNADEFFLIEVRAPKSSRITRADALGIDDVSSRDYDDVINKGLDGVFSMASATINNDSTPDELHLRVDKVMKDIGYTGD